MRTPDVRQRASKIVDAMPSALLLERQTVYEVALKQLRAVDQAARTEIAELRETVIALVEILDHDRPPFCTLYRDDFEKYQELAKKLSSSVED